MIRRTMPSMRALSLLSMARLCLYAGLFMVSLLVLRVGGTLTVGDLFLLLSFGLTVIDSVANGRKVQFRSSTMMAFALILVGGVLTSFIAVDAQSSALIIPRVVFLTSCVPWMMTVLLTTPNQVKKAFIFLAAGAAACGAGSIAQLLFGNVIPGSLMTSGSRYPGFAVHVSDTGGIVSLAVVYGAALMITSGRTSRVAGATIMMIGLVGLILSGSVSGMLAAAGGCLALMIWSRLSAIKMLLISAAVFFGGRWAINAMSMNKDALTPKERLLQVTGYSANDMSANTSASRWESIVAGWESFIDSPFLGAGLGPESAKTSVDLVAHNMIVGALFQGGLLFTVGLVVAASSPLRRGLAKRWSGGLGTIAAVGLATALLFAMTAPSFYNRYFWLPVALAFVAHGVQGKAGKGRFRDSSALHHCPTATSKTPIKTPVLTRQAAYSLGVPAAASGSTSST